MKSDSAWLQPLFFLSGAAALIYQVCWQRIFFFSFGTDIESVTVIVSAFMLGLGLGALGGGWAADKWPGRIAPLFAALELCIGLFGFASPWLLTKVSDLFIMSGRLETAAANFALMLLPTCAMGATLPMLVAHALRQKRGVGVETGELYCMNTLGAALGCGATGFVLFHFLTLKGAIAVAACVNLWVAASVWRNLRARA
jgi:predicted membrane-bound spermidine synthase